ncbi:hypothetical protein VitviT2T_014057 [Vitis vinifera]|uniref:Carbohydrate kinase FGGY C-terminal domain-containing protein n=1 Tax=Vitis vinifera TaxID=29760 RepID=A0ABY9CL76_VITVI|nr:hypothetical protein VitviT2T_014057 [Vitis vinifera]
MSHIRNSIRPTSLSGCLTTTILFGRHSTFFGWERRTIQLPRIDTSGSSGNAYLDSLLGQLGSSDTRDSPDPFPPTIKKITLTTLTTKSPELSLIFNARYIRQDILKSSQDKPTLDTLGLPAEILPKIVSNAEIIGTVAKGWPIPGLPISGCLGDQHAAMLSQACGKGAAVQWLRDNLGIISTASEIKELAAKVDSLGGIYFVPAFNGLFAPWWRDDAREVYIGITRFTNKSHIAQAVLESMCFQVKDVLDSMHKDAGEKGRRVR